jgi:hypothetical protein
LILNAKSKGLKIILDVGDGDMRITFTTGLDPSNEYSEWMKIEGCGISADIFDMWDTPEDANIARGMKWVRQLPDLLRQVYAAGINNRELEIIEINTDKDDGIPR